MAKITCEVSDGKRTVTLDAPDMIVFDQTKVTPPYYVPPISECFSSWIGKVAFVWASFETELDLFLDALIKSTNYTTSTTWKTQKYSNRAALFRGAAAQAFAATPTITSYIDSLLGRAANLQPDRNMLAHGRLSCVLEVVGRQLDELRITTTLKALDQRTARTKDYTPESLEVLYYKLAHLSGLMHKLAKLDDPPPAISSPDRQILRAFLLAHHPLVATGQKQPPPLGSSEG